MQLKDLRLDRKLFEVTAGSHAYGTNVPESDIDVRGVFLSERDAHLSLKPLPEQVSDKTNDVTFYEMKRYFKLAADCNPNIIELLWTPEDCITYQHHAAKLLFECRNLFISKKAYHTFSGYAYSQIKRAKGRNKWVNNPQSETPPDKLDFCWVVPVSRLQGAACPDAPPQGYPLTLGQEWHPQRFPFRPIPLKQRKFVWGGLENFHAAKLEHFDNSYRLYEYTTPRDQNGYCGPEVKGVFRGPHKQIVVESIPKEDEWSRFAGFLIFKEQAYDRALKDWKNYHDWVKNRNEARYRSQEAGEIDYDAKNIMHCMRLLWSGGNILRNGEPIVRFEGEKLEVLMNIRKGKYAYEEIMEMVESEKAALDELKDKSTIPNKVDAKMIDDLYRRAWKEFWSWA